MASPHMPDPPPSDWTINTVRLHLTALLTAIDEKNAIRFIELDRAMTSALQAAKEAVLKAETAAEKRFESVNEFRNTLSDQQRNLMPRSEVVVMASALSDKINALEKQVDAMKSESLGIKGGWGYAVGVVGFLLALGSLILMGVRFLQQSPP